MSPTRSAKADPDVLKDLMFGRGPVRRFTQDSPVMPDVWLAYGESPKGRLDLLLTPHYRSSAGELARRVRERLEIERQSAHWLAFHPGESEEIDVVYNQSTVAARLSFDELVRAVLPLSGWWQTAISEETEEDLRQLLAAENRDVLARALVDPEQASRELQGPDIAPGTLRHLPGILWMFRIIGALAQAQQEEMRFVTEHPEVPAEGEAPAGSWYRPLVDAVAGLMADVPLETTEPVLYSVNRNRPASPTIARSSLAIKADAARLLFSVSCKDLAWAVIDSGIDASHPAFRLREPPDQKIYSEPFPRDGKRVLNRTRIVATYDFTRIRDLLNPSKLDVERLPEALRTRYHRGDEDAVRFVEEELTELKRSLQRGREINWDFLEPLIRVPQEEGIYQPPKSDHGTHVAGILAADWRAGDPGRDRPVRGGKGEETLQGVCPDLRLYDFRVLDDQGAGDEFAVIAALQFVRHLNAHKDYIVVHGSNLSLSMYHDVSNYACGATPVCEECERLVGAGVVVVAAAGNLGWRKKESLDSGPAEGYSPISITDPGNADGVITVGATHRFMPHTYGVSYFSSRGPTGDGRSKPDLVAPGEKIEAPVPGGESRLKDGTSMAAPHVSGAAALLIARHRELAGKPKRIKQILCETATDLGREKYFQGWGMVDALRALQSV
jgi:serine protease AprX